MSFLRPCSTKAPSSGSGASQSSPASSGLAGGLGLDFSMPSAIVSALTAARGDAANSQ